MHIDFVFRPCPVCGGANNRPIITDINRREGLPISASLVECRYCGMHYLNPAPDATSLCQLYRDGSVDPVRGDVSQVQVSATSPPLSFRRSVVHGVNGLLRGHPHDWPDEPGGGRSVLDFGCHDGTKLTYWYRRGWQVAGIDLNQQAIEVAKQRLTDGKFWCADLLHLEIKERFDFIRADNVLEHLLDPGTYLYALVKLLKPEGQLRVFVPNSASFSARLFGRYSAIYWMPFHLNLFTPITLRRLLNQAGLKNVSCTTYTPIGSWTWTQRQLLLRPGFNRRPPSLLDRLIKLISIINYPEEILAQWAGYGEELVATGQRI